MRLENIWGIKVTIAEYMTSEERHWSIRKNDDISSVMKLIQQIMLRRDAE